MISAALNFFITIIFVINIGVVILTLLERKTLKYTQLSKGPNKVSFAGICQPFCGAIKLSTKEFIYP